MKRPVGFLVIFVLASCAEMFVPYYLSGSVHFVTKPMVMISLIGYYWSRTSNVQFVFLAAMLASLAGDSFLLFENDNRNFFILGLASFLVAHVLFTVSYRQRRWKARPDRLVNVQKLRLSFPVLLAGSGLIIFLYPGLGALKIPVVAYSLVLVVMVVGAIGRLGRTSAESFWLVFSGAVLFMFSDSVLAINKFSEPVPFENLLIMGSYCAAQFCIAEGMVRHSSDETAPKHENSPR